ncbi:phosphoribulokinase [Methanocalculus alkaliphilus]|uniref:phosphoribulokinase n=1 Tax=Methanocalculus alkaliphilus TaxID=768730 RepID=UPI00209D1F1E|nr:phosphoribulokinase [Methanocalculus alkaliphilus]MCP1714865.1 phosphoribulokinase [Methanocalculus alkaliphilus]
MTPEEYHTAIAKSTTPLIIGVAGDSGSGKTTFTDLIRVILGPSVVGTITLDDYHRYDRQERAEKRITPLHPDANRFDRLASDLATLRSGRAISKPVYNHETGTFDPEVPFAPRSIIIIEGLHPLFNEELRSLIDISIYVDPDDDVKFAWKVRRDVGDRGYRREEVLAEIEERKPDFEQYIAFQRKYADMIIRIEESSCAFPDDPSLYRVSLLQTIPVGCVPAVPFTLDLARILPCADGPFSIGSGEVLLDDRRLSSLTLDGYLPFGFARSLEESIEEQTTICALPFFPGRTITPTNVVALLIAWRIICRRCSLIGEPL